MWRRSSWGRSHQASDFLIGISAARVDPGRPSGSWRETRASCSTRLTYRSLLVTPRRTQAASLRTLEAACPSRTSTWEAGGSGDPETVSKRSMDQVPELPPTKARVRGSIGRR